MKLLQEIVNDGIKRLNNDCLPETVLMEALLEDRKQIIDEVNRLIYRAFNPGSCNAKEYSHYSLSSYVRETLSAQVNNLYFLK